MKKIILILLIAAISLSNAYSQGVIPGFKGKRFLLDLNLSGAPSFAGPTANNYGERAFGNRTGNIGLSSRLGLSAHYTIGRHTNAYLGYNYLKTGYTIELKTPSILGNNPDDTHKIFSTIAANTVEAGFDFVLARHIYAPIGSHFKLGAYYTSANSKVIDKRSFTEYTSQTILNNKHNPLGILNETTDYGLVVAYGMRSVIKKYITFSWGLSTYIRASNFTESSSVKNTSTENAYIYTNKTLQEEAMRDRLGLHSSLLFDFSIGYLLF
jgi:hypothetical protein